MQPIVSLPRDRYEGYAVRFAYETHWYYDVDIQRGAQGFCVSLLRKPFDRPRHAQFTDTLYAPHWSLPEAFGILEGGKPVAILEIARELWNRRLRVTNIWVDAAHRRKGHGQRLMDLAKARMADYGMRGIILETQSCNDPAIAFYLSQGFTLAGLDAFCYSNEDLAKKEVRLELAYLPPDAAHTTNG